MRYRNVAGKEKSDQIVGPIASLQYTNVYVDGFSEKGLLAPLSIHADSEAVGFASASSWRPSVKGQAVRDALKMHLQSA